MAVDGRKLRKSLYHGSDIEHDFPCLPCTQEGRNVAAIKHCVECDENLCQKCVGDHNKFSAMRVHQLLDTVKQSSRKKQQLPSQRCEKHGGKLIDVYCPDHDKVGCSTCMTVEHRSCKEITFIPDLACKTDTTQTLKFLETKINTLESRFMALKQKKVKELDNAKKEKSQLIKEIKSERKNINDRLDKMEMELLQDVDETFQTKLKHIESNMKEVDLRIAALQESLQKINIAKHENESEKYVQVKRIKEKYNKSIDCLKDFERPRKTGTLRFDPYRHETDSECNAIGSIFHLPAIEVDNSFGEFNVRIGDEKELCWILGMCMCEDGCIVITDYYNKRIKKFNESFEVVSLLNVTDNPVGICQVGTSLLAVTLVNDRKVQFISQKETMVLQQSFKVGDRCRGIAYNDGMIYVCCGGSEERKEGVGHIEVYSVTGKMVTSYYDEIKCPIYLAFPSSKEEFFVVDKGILLVDKTGGMTNVNVDDKVFSVAHCFCKINKSQLCVAFYNSHNVLLMSRDGKDQIELLAGNNRLQNPLGLCFDYKRSRLIVSCDNRDKLMVYTLKITD